MDGRPAREKEFHDSAYADGTRAAYETIYRRARGSRTYFRDWLHRHCEGKRVLELGCGTGEHAQALTAGGARVTGIDISEEAIRQARTRSSDASFRQMDAQALDFPDASFDIVCGRAILHHLALGTVMPEIARVLSPEGASIFLEPLGHNPLLGLFRRLTPRHRTPDERPLLERDLEFASSFFDRSAHRYFHLTSLAALPLSARRFGQRVYSALEAIRAALRERPISPPARVDRGHGSRYAPPAKHVTQRVPKAPEAAVENDDCLGSRA